METRRKATLEIFASGFRDLLFVLLLFGGITAVQYQSPQIAFGLDRLYVDISDGRVDAIEYTDGDSASVDVRWSTAPFAWWEASASDIPAFHAKLKEATADQQIATRTRAHGQDNLPWIKALPPGHLSMAIGLAGLLMFLTMWREPRHRHANRWAWTWLFAASPLGMLAYLRYEKRPFPPLLPPHPKTPMTGTQGFVLAIFSGIAFHLTVQAASLLIF